MSTTLNNVNGEGGGGGGGGTRRYVLQSTEDHRPKDGVAFDIATAGSGFGAAVDINTVARIALDVATAERLVGYCHCCPSAQLNQL